jgi:hypothetical protein
MVFRQASATSPPGKVENEDVKQCRLYIKSKALKPYDKFMSKLPNVQLWIVR